LPPFDTDRIAEFLQDQTRVKRALAESDLLIGNIFRDFGLDDLKEAVEDDDVLSETCASARRILLLFESLVTSELDRQKRSDQRRRRVATELLQQHRMHPAIATVISDASMMERSRRRKSAKLNSTANNLRSRLRTDDCLLRRLFLLISPTCSVRAPLQNLAGVEVDDPVGPSLAASIGDAAISSVGHRPSSIVALNRDQRFR